MDDKSAILNFMGQMYGHMKEIDTNIASTGSNAKFGGRSAELEKAFKQVAAMPTLQMPPVIVPQEPQAVIQTQPVAPSPVHTIQYQDNISTVAAPAADDSQLEFNFKTDTTGILDNIYNVLFDIKKILIEIRDQKKQPEQKEKKHKSPLAPCCLCGGRAVGGSLPTGEYTVQCRTCENGETAASETMAKVAWNHKNKVL